MNSSVMAIWTAQDTKEKKNTILEFLSYFSWAENKIHFFKILQCPRKKMHDMYFFNKFYLFKIFIPLKLSNLSLIGVVIL